MRADDINQARQRLYTTQLCPESSYFNDGSDDILRDCHAEVLARRAFKAFLMTEIQHLFNNLLLFSCHEEKNDKNLLSQRTKSFYEGLLLHLDARECILTLRSDVTVHLFTSSQPCGNATIKKFASNRDKPKEGTLLLNFVYNISQSSHLQTEYFIIRLYILSAFFLTYYYFFL
jgi:hypothetical protein